ncbi:MAG: hypothetical protein JW737_03140 [Acidobacteria bacterium]|nr:hypothetical protein [Acidobacteriota bacterium]
MEPDLNSALRSMEERILKVKQYVHKLEDENAELRTQLETFEDNLERQGKGEGSKLAKKNLQLSDKIRRYRSEREFVSEKIRAILDEIAELRRNME